MTLPLRRASEMRRWLVAWAVFSTLGCLWALASPIFSVPDEPAHAVYAAAAVRGELWGTAVGNDTPVTVPADFATASAVPICYAFKQEVPAGCAPAFGGHTGMAHTATRAGRYPPAYYIFAGLPTLVVSGAKALYLMRFLTVLLVSACLASAACSLLRTRRPKIALAGLGLATTPMVYFFAGAVNPQGPEIGASIAVWACGYVLLSRLRDDPDTPLTWGNADLRRTVLAMAGLALARPTSLLWLAVIVGLLLAALVTRTSALLLLRSRAMLWAVPMLVISCGSTLFWIHMKGAVTGEGITAYAHSSLGAAFLQSAAKQNENLQQMIGIFGWLDATPPGIVYVAYLVALGGLAFLALGVLGRRLGLTLGVLVVAVVALPVVIELMTFRQDAFFWQGRYTLPIAVGVPLLLGLAAAGSRKELPVPSRRLVASFSAVFAVVNVASLAGMLNRYIHGQSGFWHTTPPQWAPPVPDYLLCLAMLAVLAVVTVLVLRLPDRLENGLRVRTTLPPVPRRDRVGEGRGWPTPSPLLDEQDRAGVRSA